MLQRNTTAQTSSKVNTNTYGKELAKPHVVLASGSIEYMLRVYWGVHIYIWGCPINCTDWCKSPKTIFVNPFILCSSNAYEMAQDIKSQKRHLCFMPCVIVLLSRTHARIQIYRPRIRTICEKTNCQVRFKIYNRATMPPQII